ncbi:MAG: bifunctional folylpolyglutamate synthase/dihydrofolate synthase [Armatimonadetes bacterium]|nr:bifunctional folylpolyglutamate synthase/dihydrofolate synthase [Armatimonadota bacterium]
MLTYSEALDYMATLKQRGWRLGVERMRELLKRLDNPHENLRVFHVAGTNGKGSVTAMLQAVLAGSGRRVGGFFSPYVFDFRERIQFNERYVSESDIAELTDYLVPFAESMEDTVMGGPTEFEFKTAMGFLYWRKMACEFVALEVGLGGRLDATNVTRPLVSVITEIGLDHQKILGDTIEKIAAEKAAILKPGRPCVCGATHPAAVRVIERAASERACTLWRMGKEIRLERETGRESWTIRTPAAEHRGLRSGLLGEFQAANMAIAVAALDAAGATPDENTLRSALAGVSLPGRLQVISREPLVILDGAHNAHAATAVAKAVPELFGVPRLRLVFSASKGHDAEATLSAFLGLTEVAYVCRMTHDRGQPLDRLMSAAESAGLPAEKRLGFDSAPEALQAALADCAPGEAVLVTGSLYLLAQAAPFVLSVAAEATS